jgi:hypothetical protein
MANLCRPIEIGGRLAQSPYLLGIDWPPEIDRVGTVFRGLVVPKHA